MNSTSIETEIQALLRAGARAVIVLPGDATGELTAKPVDRNKSVLHLETELQDHLDHFPYATEWLEALRDYLDQRIAARGEAQRTGGISVPRVNLRQIIRRDGPALEA